MYLFLLEIGMTRLLLITLLALSGKPVYAEWVSVDGRFEERPTPYAVYVDPDTIRRNGDLVKLWVLTDFKTIQTEPTPPHLSVTSQREFQCNEERVRLLALTAFSGHMGTGNAVYSYSDSQDQGIEIEQDSVAHRLWKFACGKDVAVKSARSVNR
jgi:hypothetical protein